MLRATDGVGPIVGADEQAEHVLQVRVNKILTFITRLNR